MKNKYSVLDRSAAFGVPGTPLVQDVLCRLELCAADIESSRMSPEEFAESFIREFDWTNQKLVRRWLKVQPAISVIASLVFAARRARAR